MAMCDSSRKGEKTVMIETLVPIILSLSKDSLEQVPTWLRQAQPERRSLGAFLLKCEEPEAMKSIRIHSAGRWRTGSR